MKLEEIQKIKGYKSFSDFSWVNFLEDKTFHNNMNIFYGENGSGKSAICNILKSMSEDEPFENSKKPEEVNLKFFDEEYEYSGKSNKWNKKKKDNDFIVFDSDFISKNIHQNHKRGSKQGEQEQESGDLVIAVDQKAIELRENSQDAKALKEDIESQIEEFKEEKSDLLNFELNENEEKFYLELKDKTQDEIANFNKGLYENKIELESQRIQIIEIQNKVLDIENNVTELKLKTQSHDISGYESYQELFNFNLMSNTELDLNLALNSKLKNYRDFFDMGFEMVDIYPGQCPFCQTEDVDQNIEHVKENYHQLFGKIYVDQIAKFEQQKYIVSNVLDTVKNYIVNLDVASLFDKFEEYDREYKMQGIYLQYEKKQYEKPDTKSIAKLASKIEELKDPNNEDISEIYKNVKTELEGIVKFNERIEELLEKKNIIIVKFLEDNSLDRIKERLTTIENQLDTINEKLDFSTSEKIQKKYSKLKIKDELDLLYTRQEELKKDYKSKNDEYIKYCSSDVFINLIEGIKKYFSKFNFNFQIKFDKPKGTLTKIKVPLTFSIFDLEDNKRDFKDGVSEGEMQILSLCFFLAFLDIQSSPEDKIIIFDDPITSLDTGNLGYLVDLIYKEHKKFSQVFIFTHHQKFFKFLCKKFKTYLGNNPQGNEYNIIKNKVVLGGAFICRSKAKSIGQKLKEFDNYISTMGKNNASVSQEDLVIEYGQYLRYEIENYIKNEILLWDTAGHFSETIARLKNHSNNITESHLDEINEIYSYCNWTTSHVDIGDEHTLVEIQEKIAKFVSIVNSSG